MRVLVTGAAGYLGTAVVSALTEAGHDAVAMVHPERSNIVHAAEIRVAGLLDPVALRRALDGVDAIEKPSIPGCGSTPPRRLPIRPLLADYDAKNLDKYSAAILDGATGDGLAT